MSSSIPSKADVPRARSIFLQSRDDKRGEVPRLRALRETCTLRATPPKSGDLFTSLPRSAVSCRAVREKAKPPVVMQRSRPDRGLSQVRLDQVNAISHGLT